MKNIDIKKFFKSKNKSIEDIIIMIASSVLIYLMVSIYFTDHFFFNTVINGMDVSLKAHDGIEDIARSYIKNYKLILKERDGETEEITGRDIGMEYNEKNCIYKIYYMQNPFIWISPIFRSQKYHVDDLFVYNKDLLETRIRGLNCFNKDIVEPKNVSFKYVNGSYEVIKEIYGNKVDRDKLDEAIVMSISEGRTELDLDKNLCYENPRYTLYSAKTLETRDLLNKYVSAKITYIFGKKAEILDGNTINKWLFVDENLDVIINKKAVTGYVQGLGKKYDTVGASRNFKTSAGKTVEVKGGIYGWKINIAAETKALIEDIKLGRVLEKEPVYAQKALVRNGDDIGSTYVEINITRQHLWFYKNGKLIAHGAVVTGNPNKGNSTVLGTYMLNYKQEGATLTGPDYEAAVTYWMPFYGNIGIHDASWRSSFGGNIYKRNGTHGCVNTPLNLAKVIFDNIEAGTPIICYEE